MVKQSVRNVLRNVLRNVSFYKYIRVYLKYYDYDYDCKLVSITCATYRLLLTIHMIRIWVRWLNSNTNSNTNTHKFAHMSHHQLRYRSDDRYYVRMCHVTTQFPCAHSVHA